MATRRPILLSHAAVLSVGLLGAACKKDPQDSTDAHDPKPTILVVVMDGVRLEESFGDEASTATGELPQDMMPVIWDELAPQGYRSTNAWNLSATTTAPAHAVLVSGRRRPYANFSMGDRPGMYRPLLPGVHEVLEHAGAIGEKGASIIANTSLLEGLGRSLWTWPDHDELHGASWVAAVKTEEEDKTDFVNDKGVLSRLRREMEHNQVEFALLNLHKVDLQGHYGSTDDYPEAVRGLDEPLADLWAWIQESPRYADHTWLVLLADHGRNNTSENNPVWRHHGCQCNGCRRIPLMVLGPGVRAAAEDDSPVLLTDIAPTLAALRGQAMPWADGLVRDDMLESPTLIPSRTGLADIAEAGGHRAELRYSDDPAHRKRLYLDGEDITEATSIEIEAPVMASNGDQTWLCYRELSLTPEERNTQWNPRCKYSDDDGLSWEGIGVPATPVGPWWRPAMVPTADGLLMTYPYNPNGLANTSGGVDGQGSYHVEAAFWNGQFWTTDVSEVTPIFPTDIVAVEQEGGRIVTAMAGSTQSTNARNTRSLYSGPVTVGHDRPTFGELVSVHMDDLHAEDSTWRLEHPALWFDDDDVLSMAGVGYSKDGVHAVLATGRGRVGWQQTAEVELPGLPLPHLPPIWVHGRPAWAVQDIYSGLVRICAALPDEEATCVDTDSERVLRLRPGDARLLAIVDASEGEWELMEIDTSALAAD